MKRGRDKSGDKKERKDGKKNNADIYDKFVYTGRPFNKDTDHEIRIFFPTTCSHRTIPKSILDTFRMTKLDVKRWIKTDNDERLIKRLEVVDGRWKETFGDTEKITVGDFPSLGLSGSTELNDEMYILKSSVRIEADKLAAKMVALRADVIRKMEQENSAHLIYDDGVRYMKPDIYAKIREEAEKRALELYEDETVRIPYSALTKFV